jgi:hypothetical protein
MTHQYHTNVFKDPNGTKEPILQSIYSYRKKQYSDAALSLLDSLISAIAHRDMNNSLLRYLLTLEGPSYICQRYWDWIEPHVKE